MGMKLTEENAPRFGYGNEGFFDQMPISALGHKQTFCDSLPNVRFWRQSGHHRNLGSASAGFSFAGLVVDLVVEGAPVL